VLLAVVARPVRRENPLVILQAAECDGARHRHDHAHRGDVDRRLVEECRRPAEDPHVVLVEAEHDPQVDRDTVAVQRRDDAPVVLDPVVGLVGRCEALLRNRFEPEE
jgi:hypothetical protein